MMGVKTKGINAERQLMHKLWDKGFAAIRIAGSGSSQYPSADLIVGNQEKKYVIECKTTKKDKKYFSREEIQDFLDFAHRFGGQPFIAIRFFRTEWLFVKPEFLVDAGKNMVLTKESAQKFGIDIDKL